MGFNFIIKHNKQENDESSLAERSEGKGVGPRFIVGPAFMAPWVGRGTYPVYFVKAWFK
jgi:hypothetical protein